MTTLADLKCELRWRHISSINNHIITSYPPRYVCCWSFRSSPITSNCSITAITSSKPYHCPKAHHNQSSQITSNSRPAYMLVKALFKPPSLPRCRCCPVHKPGNPHRSASKDALHWQEARESHRVLQDRKCRERSVGNPTNVAGRIYSSCEKKRIMRLQCSHKPL